MRQTKQGYYARGTKFEHWSIFGGASFAEIQLFSRVCAACLIAHVVSFVVRAQMARAYAEDNNIMFLETSAKTAHNVNELFVAIARKLPKGPAGGAQPKQESVVLDPDQTDASSGGCCK